MKNGRVGKEITLNKPLFIYGPCLCRFNKAMAVADAEFRDKVSYFGNSWWPARLLSNNVALLVSVLRISFL